MAETKKCEYCRSEINVKSKICPFCSGGIHDLVVQERLPTCLREGRGQKD
jgi:hypothetical protein